MLSGRAGASSGRSSWVWSFVVSGSPAVGIGVEVDDDDDEAARSRACWLRRAATRTLTYSVTWFRISRPIDHQPQLGQDCNDTAQSNVPTINVSGSTGANPINSPPNPHPISATSTSLRSFREPDKVSFDSSGSTKAG